MEGYLPKCLGAECPVNFCTNGVAENTDEFKRSPRAQILDQLAANGILLKAEDGLVRMSGCIGDQGCKILALSPDVDIRPLKCKIFPYKLYQDGHNENVVWLSLTLCPATFPEFSVSEEFTQEVMTLVKNYFSTAYQLEVQIEFFAGVQES